MSTPAERARSPRADVVRRREGPAPDDGWRSAPAQRALDGSARVARTERRADGLAQRAVARTADAPAIQRHASRPVVQREPNAVARGVGKAAAVGAGVWGGAKLGGALGAWLGPLGAAAGGVVGGLVGGLAGYAASGIAIERSRVPRMEAELRAITEREQPGSAGWQAYTDRQMRDLDALEHEAYGWLDENRLNPGASRFAPRILDLLDPIQGAHETVVGEVHGRNLELWTPDRDSLGLGERGRLRQAWDALRNGTGLVRSQGPADAGGEDLLRASHARLLSRPAGRRLLYTLLDMEGPARNKAVTVRFTRPGARGPEQKATLREKQAALDRLGVRLQAAKPGTDLHDDLYGEHALAKWEVMELSGASDAAKASADDKHASSLGGNRAGSTSTVDLRQGTRDSDDLAYDWFGRAIPSPAFLQYGHELVHALHNRNAESRTGEEFGLYHGGRWTDKEEYTTIKGLRRGDISENALRAEHGITGRFGHTGTSRDEWQGR